VSEYESEVAHVESIEVEEFCEFFGVGEVLFFLFDDLNEVLDLAFEFVEDGFEMHGSVPISEDDVVEEFEVFVVHEFSAQD